MKPRAPRVPRASPAPSAVPPHPAAAARAPTGPRAAGLGVVARARASRPTLRQLECVVAVAEQGSFRGAAGTLGLSQPALSAHVAQLERDLGVQVFERDRRRVLITPAGDAVIAQARSALTAADGVVDIARGAAEPLAGPLRIGVIPTVAPYLLPRALPAVRARFPRLRPALREDQTARVLRQLDEGALDCAIVALPVPGDLTAAQLYREEFLLAVASTSPLASRRRARDSDLDGETLLLLEDGHCLRDQALSVCHGHGAVEETGLQATSLPTLVQMVASGMGVTLLPEMAAAVLAPRASSGIATIRFAPPAPGRDIGLVWRTSSARLPELRLLAQTITTPAQKHLDELRA
jgi:LysR family transcriptional regulator, hydrogen peroxide-inducible genes activator